jgi:hypothetical protein
MEDKFCFGCAKYKKADQLTKVKRGKTTRIMCRNCLENRSGSWFSKKEKVDEVDKKDP